MFKKNGLLSKNIPNSSGEMENYQLSTIQASMLLLSGSIMKNLSTFLQPLQQRQNSCRVVTQK